MKKLIIGLVVLAMVSLSLPVSAGNTDTITVTLSPQATIDISVSPDSWTPTASLNHSDNTTTTYFTIDTLDTDVNISIDVKASNTADWTIGDTASHDVFVLGITPNGGSETELTTSDQTIWDDVSPGNDPQFGLNLDMPTTSSTSQDQTVTITFTASALA